MSRVLLSNVVKVYDRKTIAVDNVSFEIADGEFFVLVGPSGCGKSTVLRLIAGLEELTSGSIYIGDRLVNDVAPKDRDIAMVFQNYALYPHMTAFENMAFGLRLRKVPKDEIRSRVEAAAKILGIEHLLDRRPRALSGGERQRVAVGRAIVRQPKVFLFDEPLSNLDAKMRIQMRAELTRIHKQLGTTILYVTHDQVEAMTLGQRIGVMAKGKLLQIAGAMELYQRPVNRFVAGFIGSPPMNFIAGVLEIRPEGIRFRTEVWEFCLQECWKSRLSGRAGEQLVAGIRPEDIAVIRGPDSSSVNRAQVEVVEPMGNETLVYLRAGGASLVARGSSALHPGVGETVAVSVNTERLLFFDPETGAAL